MIGKGDDRGRWIFLAIAVFAILGKAVPELLDMPRDKVQTGFLIGFLPVAVWAFWSLREKNPGLPSENAGEGEPAEPASSDAE